MDTLARLQQTVASVHFSIWAPNVQRLVQRAGHPRSQPQQGHFGRPPGPGIGTELLPELWRRKDAVIRVSPA